MRGSFLCALLERFLRISFVHMKRLRSYGEDLDDAAGKEWERREIDSDRSSSRRRFYPQSGSLRRSSSSLYDRSVDDDEEPLRPPRKRFENEADGFDRRKMFDRYRDGGGGGVDRVMHVSSPRDSYGGDRMHRSESFSGLRREFPKGFRSDRDRSRREGCGGSSWRRFSFGKVGAGEEKRYPALDSEDRGRARSRDSSSGEQSKEVEAIAAEKEKTHMKESCSSSEMEEGELEPDPEPEPSVDTIGQADKDSLNCRDEDGGYKCVSDGTSEKKDVFLSRKKSDSVSGTSRSVETQVNQLTGNVAVQDGSSWQSEIVKRLDGETRGNGEGFAERGRERESLAERRGETEDLAEDNSKEELLEGGMSGRDKKERTSHESSHLPSQGPVLEMKLQGEEEVIKDDELVNVYAASVGGNLEYKVSEGHDREVEVIAEKKMESGFILEALQNEEKGMDQFDQEVEQWQGKGIDLQAAFVNADGSFSSIKETTTESNLTPKPITNEIKENPKDKGKSIAFSLSNNAGSAEDGDDVEGPSRRGFELIFRDYVAQPEKGSSGGLYTGKIEDKKLDLEPLDLSLGLPGVLPDENSKPPNTLPSSPCRTRSIQSLPSSFRTISDGFTASISFSGSQPFVHNPSCSLTQNSMDNFEQSVGSRPIFQGVDQVSSGTIWQGPKSNEPKRKGGASALFHKALLNGNHSQTSLQGMNAHHHLNSLQQPSLPKQLSPTQSVGSHDTRSEHSNDKRILTRERSFNSLSRSEHREGEQLVVNVPSVVERIITRIVSEPLQVVDKMLQDMTQHSIAYLKDSISRMLADTDKQRQIYALQGALRKRCDLTSETMTRCPRIPLEILVALKTGLPDFIQRPNNASLSDLVEIYQNLRCRNLACRTILPVDDCDCKICSQKNGFCSDCMCLICSKFDMASNTCSWVGCDVCLHWCHTDCGLRNSHIRNGQSSSVATEMQFHCVACGHPSEMFGFVKEVFKTCSKGWKAENLAKELQYVRRIFSSSNDVRGKSLYHVAGQMLMKLEDKKKHSEVVKYIMTLFSESESTIRDDPPLYSPREPSVNIDQRSNAEAFPIAETAWLPPVSMSKASSIQHASAASSMDGEQMGRQRNDAELQMSFEKKPVVDELESVVGFKQTEAKMYQERADNARREAEGLKRIAIAKNGKIEDEYSSKMAKLQLQEAEERRRQKLEELQTYERAHHDFMNMKTRMEAEIKDLLLKMEVARLNFNA